MSTQGLKLCLRTQQGTHTHGFLHAEEGDPSYIGKLGDTLMVKTTNGYVVLDRDDVITLHGFLTMWLETAKSTR